MPAAADAAPFTDDEIEALFEEIGTPDGVHGAIIAVSGGSDSLGLLLLLKRRRDLEIARGEGITPLVVATIDHGLRPGSAAEAREVAALCVHWGLDYVTLRWQGDKPATGIQEAARDARYALLFAEAARRGFEDIVTAHTIDDQAETVLMRLARGSGLKGLGGMEGVVLRKDTLWLHRPLLEVSRARLRAALVAAGVTWIDDPSNTDPRFLRPRLRAILPALAEEGLTAERFSDVGRKLRRAYEAIELVVKRIVMDHLSFDAAKQRVTIPLDAFSGQPLEIRMHLLAGAIETVVSEASSIGDAQLEHLTVEIEAATFFGETLRRNLGGALVSLGKTAIRITPEPPRRESRG